MIKTLKGQFQEIVDLFLIKKKTLPELLMNRLKQFVLLNDLADTQIFNFAIEYLRSNGTVRETVLASSNLDQVETVEQKIGVENLITLSH